MAERFKIDKTESIKIIKGGVIAFAGAGLIALLTYFGNIDFGANTAVMAALCAVLVNVVRVWVKDNTKTIDVKIK